MDERSTVVVPEGEGFEKLCLRESSKDRRFSFLGGIEEVFDLDSLFVSDLWLRRVDFHVHCDVGRNEGVAVVFGNAQCTWLPYNCDEGTSVIK